MSYYRDQVDAAERRIRKECPTAYCERFDYGFGLLARKGADGGPIHVIIVFQPERDDLGQAEIIADLDAVVKELNDG